YAALGRPEEARRALARARELYRARHNHVMVGSAAAYELRAVHVRYRAAELAEGERLAAEAEAAWTRTSGALGDRPPRVARLPLLLVGGQWDEARAVARA